MTRTISAAPVKKTLQVAASQAHAFEVFTARIGAWWPHSHSINSGIPQKEVIIEPRRGGRWYERGEDGSECYWGDVVAWDPPSRVVLSWHLNGKFQFDRQVESEVEVRFIAEGEHATRVELEHRITAAQDAEALRKGIDAPNGWSGILAIYGEMASKT
jgi:uncharacterized protein YndB with AHSA1/START domain